MYAQKFWIIKLVRFVVSWYVLRGEHFCSLSRAIRNLAIHCLGMTKLGLNRKLFSASIVALVLCVFVAALLLYSTVVVAPDAAEGPEPLFDVDIEYAYAESRNSGSLSEDGPVFHVVLNFTLYSEVDLCDAIYEVHQIEVYSDEGPIGNVTKAQGIMFNHSTSTLRQGMSLSFDDFAEYGAVSSGASGSWPVNKSALLFFVNEETSCVPDFGESETVFVRVSRLGLVTLKDGSSEVTVLSEPEVVAEAQLEKFGDGYLYNNIIPEDQLAEIDPFNPFMWIFSE